jgi:hypothetical protein
MITFFIYLALVLAIISVWLLLKGESISSLFHTFVGIGFASISSICFIIACFIS